jgi:hypothetical protein
MLQAESLSFCFAVPVLLEDHWAANKVSDIFNHLMLHQSARYVLRNHPTQPTSSARLNPTPIDFAVPTPSRLDATKFGACSWP